MAISNKQGIKMVISELKGIGLDDHAIAGVLGNLEAESGWRPSVVNGSGHTGLAQWDTSRFATLTSLARKNGWGDPKGWKAQAKYLAHEIKTGSGGTSVKALNGSANAAEAAKVFEDQFERSGGDNIPGRVAAAQKFSGSKILKGTGATTQQAHVKGASGGEMTWVPKVGPTVGTPYGQPGDWQAGHHTGADIPGNAGGQPIRWAPPVSGRVVKQETNADNPYGYYVIVRDEKNREWLLAHMKDPGPKVGTVLNQGDQIGNVGSSGTRSSGPHLHVEMTQPLAKGEHWAYDTNVKKPKIVFKVGPGGQVYDKNFKPVTSGDFLESVGLSGQALSRPSNEELQALVDEAVRKEWTNLEFTRRFKQTQWYIDRAGSQREFDMLQDTDQQQKIKQQTSKVTAMAAQMGIELSPDEARKLAIKIERDGFTQEQTQWFIAKRMDYDPAEAQTGLVAAYEDQLKDTAREYGVTLGNDQIAKWVQQSVGRGVDIDSFEDQIRDIAYDQNPFLRDALDNGLTTREALGSKLSSAAEVLGVDPSQIDITQEKWRKIFDANGAELADSTWRSTIKTDPQYGYGYTQNGLNEANTIGRNLLRAMGGLSNG
jgi:murein DD-endopeptidase MepM/ murein hydrolase activator NlpD